MSATNPRKAVAAFLPAPIPIPGTAETVQPFSLATYGILEKIGSPLVMPVQGPVTALDLIPSLYVVTHDAAEVLAGDIAADSVAWAKTLPPTVLLPMEQAARRQIGVLIDVLPEAAKKKPRGRRLDRRTRRMGLRNLRLVVARGGFRGSCRGAGAPPTAVVAGKGRKVLFPLRNRGDRWQTPTSR